MILRRRKRRMASENEKSANSPGTDVTYIPVVGQTVVQKKSKSECDANYDDEVKSKKVKVESCKRSPVTRKTILRKRKAECGGEGDVKSKKSKLQSSSERRKSSHVEGQTILKERKAECEGEVKSKKPKLENFSKSYQSSPEDELYDLTYQVSTSRTDFESKYLELHKLGTGGFGSVFAGIRLQDTYSVAIKHIAWDNVLYKNVMKNGIMYKLIEEVALMVKLAQGSCPAIVHMLDCYDLPEELILVMERPNPALDLHCYKKAQGGVLKEEEAKNILKQVMEASIQMHNSGVFHRDLKPENILVEVGQEFLKAWIIDFGCGCLVKEGTYDDYSGTNSLAPPEWYSSKAYRAEPTTVYHLGALLYDLLHYKSFSTRQYMRKKRRFRSDLSKECLSFLKSCLAKDLDSRPTFEMLQHHPWFF